MPKQVNLYEAKTQLSGLVEQAAQGEEIVIAKNGKPMARLISAVGERAGQQRRLGQWAKLVTPEEAARLGTPEWWRQWKRTDAEIEQEFAQAEGQVTGAKKRKWRAIFSTPTPSSGSRRTHTKLPGAKRSRK